MKAYSGSNLDSGIIFVTGLSFERVQKWAVAPLTTNILIYSIMKVEYKIGFSSTRTF
jgi:hypothetical protein